MATSKIDDLLRFLKNLIGRLRGFGGCGICGDRWNWKAYELVRYGRGSGAFPVCCECWEAAPHEAIVAAGERLAAVWREQGCDEDGKPERMAAAVARASSIRPHKVPMDFDEKRHFRRAGRRVTGRFLVQTECGWRPLRN